MDIQEMLLFYSFMQIPRISEKKEQAYWAGGIRSLADLGRRSNMQQTLFEDNTVEGPSIQALARHDIDFFSFRLPEKYYYRIAYSFPEDVMFLDIETTGLSNVYHYVTMVGWIMNGKYDCWIQGTDPTAFLASFQKAKMIVTFNGVRFDCKFLDRTFRTGAFTQKANLDLMYLCRRFDLKGGQKKIESSVGFARPDSVGETNGKEAIALWYAFLFGDQTALEQLVTYNFYDILGMTYILDHVFFRHIYAKEYPKVGHPRPFYNRRIRMNRKRSLPTGRTCAAIRNFVKAHISNFSIDQLSAAGPYQIVGIDLAGKTSSRTGLCALCNHTAKTQVAHTNKEIIQFVQSAHPELISIDAPLSLPKGRTTVYDDDPAREEAGIVRYCERVLKSRGVNSYPALIRSMQELTKRGIYLAEWFRNQGYPVIECFPGAAQDVVQLPRKRTDESLLKKGLSAFGIHGDFQTTRVYHDELDAITAALVGQFFISDYFEPLGIPEENDMIIPQRELRPPAHKLVIGLAGPVATGKTETGRHLEQLGFRYIRYSQIIAEGMECQGQTADRSGLRKEGWALYNGCQQYALNQRLGEAVGSAERLVIDGMRHLEDYTFWKERAYRRFFLVYIDSDYELCQKRFQSRGGDDISYREAMSAPVEQHVIDLMKKADFIIKNNGTLDQLFEALAQILSNLER